MVRSNFCRPAYASRRKTEFACQLYGDLNIPRKRSDERQFQQDPTPSSIVANSFDPRVLQLRVRRAHEGVGRAAGGERRERERWAAGEG